jgi:flagellum-specific ATP synthase
MNDVVGNDHQQAARKFRRLVSLYMENRDLLLMGGYAPGQDPELDLAVSLWPALMKYIQQQESQKADFASSQKELLKLMAQ